MTSAAISAIARAIELSGGPAKVAQLLGVSVQAVCFWRDGKRDFPTEHAATVELACNLQVRRWDMFPADWRRIWPELAGVPGAPFEPPTIIVDPAWQVGVRDESGEVMLCPHGVRDGS